MIVPRKDGKMIATPSGKACVFANEGSVAEMAALAPEALFAVDELISLSADEVLVMAEACGFSEVLVGLSIGRGETLRV